ncbi:MAG: leucine-rich repeat protein [Eubacterium sp.]|nr:leucine-rich repeat protein [Eubacterium sp.]
MKLRKVVSGILACAMILSSVPAMAEGDAGTAQSGPRISYTVPREGSFPVPAKVTVGAEHYSAFEDKAKNPVQMSRVEGSGEPVVENCDGAWGFNGQIMSGENDDKFDVSGNDPMIISFRLYLKRMGTEDQGHVILAKGDRQYSLELMSYGLRFHSILPGGTWRNYTMSNCFTKGLNQWYNIVLVKDGKTGIRIYVDDIAGEVLGYRSLAHYDAPFSIGTQIEEGTARRPFTSEYGYVADLKFFNGAAMEEDKGAEFDEAVDLGAWDEMPDDGKAPLYELLETVEPTADFSFKPYKETTVWSESASPQAPEAPTAAGERVEVFQCGTAYTATTTLTVRDGDPFQFTEAMGSAVEGEFQSYSYYNKIPSSRLTGAADSEKGFNDDGPASWAVDGDENTMWHSNYGPNATNLVDFDSPTDKNNTYTITLDEPEEIARFVYVPKQKAGGSDNGIIKRLNLYGSASDDGDFELINQTPITWTMNREKKEENFEPRKIKRLRIEVLDAHSNDADKDYISAAEFYLYQRIDVLAPKAVAEVSEDGKKMTVQASYLASDVPCTHAITDSVSIGNLINMEIGNTRLLTPSVLMDDGSLLSEHKGLSTSVTYEFTSDNTAVASVDEKGLVTAVAEGKANITVKTTLPGQDAVVKTVAVEVFPEGSMFLHPEMKYKKPAADEYPEIAEVWLNTEKDDKHPTVITDLATGDAHWETLDPDQITVEKKEGLIGFNGQYRSSGTTNQFNVTGNNPLVILFKLWVDKLPTGGAGDTERAIATKGEQFSFSIKKDSEASEGAYLCLRALGTSNDQSPLASYDIPAEWTGKWHDIVIVFDGKGRQNSMGFFVDGEFVPNKTNYAGTIGNSDYKDGAMTTALRPFMICGKADESDTVFTKEDGFLAGFKFFDVKAVASDIVEKIDLSQRGNRNGAAIIKYLLDAKDRTAHVTATPYKMQTTWSVAGETEKLDGTTQFEAQKMRSKGYTATTVLTTYQDYVFDAAEVEHIQEELRHIYVEPEIDPSLIEQKAEISDDHKTLTVKVTFLSRDMKAPNITYTSPIPGGTPKRQPISNDENAHYTMGNSIWSIVDGPVLGENATFEKITETNKYQVRTVLKTRGDYLFDNSAEFIEEAKENIITQRYGNVDARTDISVKEDGSEMTITVTYETPIYTVTFDTNGADSRNEEMQSVSNGNMPNEPDDPSKDKYSFVCWYEDGDESVTPYDFTKPVTANVSLIAKWARELTVTFDSQVPGMPENSITVLEGDKVPAPEAPENGSKEFLGWYLKDGDNYTAYDFDAPLTEDITLYAYWIDENDTREFTITYMDGNQKIKEEQVRVGTTLTPPELEAKEGYTFAGWYMDEEFLHEFKAGMRIVSNTTLHAKWNHAPITATGIAIDPESVTLEVGGTQKLTAIVTPDHAVDADVVWSSEDESFVSVDDKGNVTAHAVGDVNITAALTSNSEISAQALVKVVPAGTVKNKYTVTFDSKGGSAVPSQTVEEGSAVKAPANPTKSGYIFKGWHTDENVTRAYDFNAPVNADFTLYAKWEPAQGMQDPGLQTQIKVGDIKVIGPVSYKVTDVTKNTVAVKSVKNKKLKKINVPNTIEIDKKIYTVTEISNNAFKNCAQATQVTIGKNVKKIGASAFFGCKKLRKVIFKGTSVKKIGKKAFKGTHKKMVVKVPKKFRKNKAFKKKLTSAGMSKKVKIKQL